MHTCRETEGNPRPLGQCSGGTLFSMSGGPTIGMSPQNPGSNALLGMSGQRCFSVTVFTCYGVKALFLAVIRLLPLFHCTFWDGEVGRYPLVWKGWGLCNPSRLTHAPCYPGRGEAGWRLTLAPRRPDPRLQHALARWSYPAGRPVPGLRALRGEAGGKVMPSRGRGMPFVV